MEIKNNGQAIYLQIADYISKKILLGEWLPEQKIPSVTELGIQISVNPNTVARSYEFLKNSNIIIDKRGIGYFVEKEGIAAAKKFRYEEFFQNELPVFFNTLYTLGIELADLEQKYQDFKERGRKNQ